ncbi:methyl-accepting chemotaxis protein [Pseudomonas fluorescens]|uniref:Methyl-accepting chemotaxis protein n=4 Tax=Gammaproteobacteria TaxID=1236 RepID=A0ABT5NAX9_9PSED|nr:MULTISPECIES: methyl-accepting chemotaxis protein [Pseudomonas]AYG09868.1 methyl-accepting chemotaxis protein [Pseudomonas fluorescens]MBJ2240043.1 HAMP domain-containing protein [Pseudomonas sp. MF6768]MBJ2250950.1 HAMP domain-containing protein [Pseudomonas sp. MF6784]MBJ2262588.1 HAMP domain-containing protein [Pseudomonas sp. MF6787]MBJ2265973.1 HAMP domain-containing protein [Pseudomonas sp. MF6772]NMX31891.1 HAMP domain-containing protein [Pseudomonas sp. WS 5413]NMY19534.1 HAMP dom
MKSLLYPAIALMNRLSFGMKFSLISVLFFLPMLVTNYYLVRDSWREFQGTQVELQSLDLLGSSLILRRDLETLNNQVQINATLGQAGKAGDIESQISALEQRVLERLQGFQAMTTDPEQVAVFEGKRDEMIAAFKAQQSESSLLSKSALIGKLLNKAQMFSQIIASQSGLSRDVQGDVRQLSELITSVTPQVTQTLGEGRAMGAYSLGQGFLNSSSSTRFDELLQQLEKLQAEYGLKVQDALGSSKAAHGSLDALAQASQASLKQGSELFEEQVVMAETLEAPWQTFYDEVTALMAKTYQLDDATLSFLDQQLQQRLAQNRTHMVLLVTALAAVFLLIFYLYGGFYASTRTTLRHLGAMMDKVAAGDMTVSFKSQSRDELGELGEVFNGTVAKIHDLIERVGQTVQEVEHQAGQVESVSARSNQAVSGQRSQIEQVATAMNQMSATAHEVARSAAAAVSSAHSVNDETLNGRGLVQSQQGSIALLASEIDQSVLVINQLAIDSQSISSVLEVIKSIAEQTNLLALNAAIEAARAGEQGRGFAVVADEVRTLARRTQHSTEEIEQMIAKLHQGVGAAVKAMGSSHKMASGTVGQSEQVQLALENILGAVGMIVDQNQQIAAAVEQQTAVAHDIDQNIVEINRAGEHAAQGAHQTEEASRQLSLQVIELKKLIGAFRV